MPFPESGAFEVPALIRRLELALTPPSTLNAPHNWASVSATPSVSPGPPVPRSCRLSYHDIARYPVVSSSESLGRNWLLVVASSFTRRPALQVAPPSSECRR